MKKLKLFNGRGHHTRTHGDYTGGHFFIGAHSQKHAAELFEQLCGGSGNLTEIRDYYNKGSWGLSMEGIEPEIGVWASHGYNDKPVKLI